MKKINKSKLISKRELEYKNEKTKVHNENKIHIIDLMFNSGQLKNE